MTWLQFIHHEQIGLICCILTQRGVKRHHTGPNLLEISALSCSPEMQEGVNATNIVRCEMSAQMDLEMAVARCDVACG